MKKKAERLPENSVRAMRVAIVADMEPHIREADSAIARGDTRGAIESLIEVVRHLKARVSAETPILDEEIAGLLKKEVRPWVEKFAYA